MTKKENDFLIQNLHQAYLFVNDNKASRETYSLNFIRRISEEKFLNINNPDFLTVNPKTTKYGINLIREIKIKLSLKPYYFNKKIVLLNDAHELTTEAQNALLKTLEEPQQNSVIILTVNHRNNLLPTITSRCEIFNIPKEIKEIETVEIDKTDIEEFLNISQNELTEKFKWVEQNYQKEGISQTLQNWLLYNRKLLLNKINEENSNQLLIYKLLKNTYEIDKTLRVLKTNASPRLALEILVIKLENID
ncbi:hypothetical protein A2X44_01925 [candidate division CPR3 bacterium GWF2_35_18]|uniref:Polymerase III, delta'' subunit protein n=1 Tax=candidate division CPR3 bacterium GW2011_GWF2_35_18 TaxID=1618350 RepID=A0A0G0BKI2_UNCC3|nr:MAG: polymerase III, delta'' subunit protein [candidate division CPR3 bacterium GW2011_GWF2_35_18]OGB62757.1 MAG: hypothetical protein A2X44_01925 [candidate division CPR3 bacterium GWF2_35_18]OGB65338.1 MAG: hypothetical protein A2250_00140 [candidate division CPR3 bacterium RIFOXYA2_FULL_35_13]OGB77150.1 MAG: hypothetical protein A2476_01510 [candidate division CPR3 bacterium RIFOXYC2_FULL_35_7]OGB78300.1 MAG: hypothetical protein A2296_02915 [candidate division CPR3 bacterium RIFOXYB2_FUL